MKLKQRSAIFLLALTGLPIIAFGQVPKLVDRVNDYADLIPDNEEATLEALLKTNEETTSNQIVILTIGKLPENQTVEQYANKVFETWKLGQADKDNGILIVQSVVPRKLRIEVGRGLEGAIPDGMAGRIMDDEMIPHFKAGKMGMGHKQGIEALIKASAGEYQPKKTDVAYETTSSPSDYDKAAFWFKLGLLAVIQLVVCLVGMAIIEKDDDVGPRCISALVSIVVMEGVLWLTFGIGPVSFLVMLILAALLGFFAPETLKVVGEILKALDDSSSGGGGGSGSSGGSSGGGSSYGGGGGSSGGGGASRSW